MLDSKFVRENPEIVKQATLVKRVASPELVDAWLMADAKRRDAQTQFDSLRNEQKKVSEFVAKLKREQKAGTSAELQKLIAQANAMKVRRDELMAGLTAAESDCRNTMLQLPAIPDPSWPVGEDDSGNVVARIWSDPAHPPLQLDAGRKDHIRLGKDLGILDLERGVKLAGSRSYVRVSCRPLPKEAAEPGSARQRVQRRSSPGSVVPVASINPLSTIRARARYIVPTSWTAESSRFSMSWTIP